MIPNILGRKRAISSAVAARINETAMLFYTCGQHERRACGMTERRAAETTEPFLNHISLLQ